ncbi:MAG: hypothetical protein H0T53_02270 [Herpetosiphonaceae bacterium]|nr:hypothetical protein [Herpetosiphonaceae bacterium]
MAESENDLQAMQRWLALGLGRAVLHLELYDSAPYRDLILHTCLYDERFHTQGEPDRAPYLYDVLLASGAEDDFRVRIQAALAEPDDDMNVDELCGLLLEWARRGDAECRRVLYKHAGELADEGWSCPADRLIDLDGWDGFVFAAERLGAAILAGADEIHAGLLNQIKDRLGENEALERLNTLRARNHLIAAYLNELESDEAKSAARSIERKRQMALDYWQLKAAIAAGERRWPRFSRRWLNENPAAPWHAIAQDVLAETDADLQASCLQIFSEVEFPLGHTPLLPLLWSDHERLVRAAVEALDWFEHPDIRVEALALLEADQYPATTLRLLAATWQPGDYALIEARLRGHASIEALHELGLATQSIVEENLVPEAAAVLLYLYEQGPCAFCRHRAVEHLLALDLLPDWMRHECCYDANPDIRALVRPG